MIGYIDTVDFINAPVEKHWSFPKTYNGDKRKEIEYMIRSGQWIGSYKQDGYYARFIKDEDGNMFLQGKTKERNGTYLNKIEWIPQCKDFFNSLPNGTCLLGVLYFPNQKNNQNISTILKYNKDKVIQYQDSKEKLCYYIFDVWAYKGKSLFNTTIENRIYKYLNKEIATYFNNNKYIKIAEYFSGDILWNQLGIILKSGGEGIVITKKGSKPEQGKTSERKILKVTNEIEQNIYVFLTGHYTTTNRELKEKVPLETYPYWQNIKTQKVYFENKFKEYVQGEPIEPISQYYALGYAESVEIGLIEGNRIIPIGFIFDITNEVKQEIALKNEQYKNKVLKITALEIKKNSKGLEFNHLLKLEWQNDKTYRDCKYSQIKKLYK